MLGVEFEKIKNVTIHIYNEGTFFSKKDFQLHSSFKGVIWLQSGGCYKFKVGRVTRGNSGRGVIPVKKT